MDRKQHNSRESQWGQTISDASSVARCQKAFFWGVGPVCSLGLRAFGIHLADEVEVRSAEQAVSRLKATAAGASCLKTSDAVLSPRDKPRFRAGVLDNILGDI